MINSRVGVFSRGGVGVVCGIRGSYRDSDSIGIGSCYNDGDIVIGIGDIGGISGIGGIASGSDSSIALAVATVTTTTVAASTLEEATDVAEAVTSA